MTLNDRRQLLVRAHIAFGVVALGLVGVGMRVAVLQIGRHEELAKVARDEYLKDLRVPARRGHIYDKSGKPLAISVEVPSVYANPSVIEDPRHVARALSRVLSVDLDTVYRRLSSDKLFVWLERQVSPEVAKRVRALDLPGVDITKESRRFYPNRELGAHVVGFTGVDGSGLEGIERQLDSILAGEPQVVATVRDARGRAVLAADVDVEQQSAGSDVHLALDLRLQHAAQSALERKVAETGAVGAVAVLLDAATAEVLAMAVEPTFNPNEPLRARPAVRRNRAVTDMFEPGSTMKPLMVAGALEARVVEPTTKIFCENGQFVVGNHTINDSKPHGWLDVTQIVARSSNIGAAKIGQQLGRHRLAANLRALGFGARTGVSFPGETAGSVRDADEWSAVGTATVSFGHGVAVSALQLAAAYRVLANGGRWDPPVLVRAVEKRGGLTRAPRPAGGRQVLASATTAQVTAMMEAAVGPGGTGWRAAVPGYRVAGKTGTAQKVDMVAGGYSDDRFVAVFAGFLPADAPRVVIVVAVDEPKTAHSGGVVAAPVFAEIGEASMRFLGVVPTEPLHAGARPAPKTEEPAPVAVTIGDVPTQTADAVPSFLGLTARQVLARYAQLGSGLNLEFQGSGLVVQQNPKPGAARGRGGHVTLLLAER